jgi:tetratricopeptide (TPR) repeat protein
MIRSLRIVAGMTAIAAAAALALPANAQYSNEFRPAKLVQKGSSSKSIAGSGTVIVQVQVNANGTHRVVKIIKSSNPGDNAAAMDIAATSTYTPAHRGKTPITSYYDFTLKFRGHATSSSGQTVVASGSAAARIDALIHQGKYDAAKTQLEEALEKNPGDAILNEEFGTADFFLNDYEGAAAAFNKVPTIGKVYTQVAASAFANAAVKLADSNNADQALAYAKRAVQISPNASSYFALGAANLTAGNNDDAIANLKKAHDLVFADPKSDAKTRAGIDSRLLVAYLKAGNASQAQAIQTEMKSFGGDAGVAAGRTVGNYYIQQGNQAQQAGKLQDALNDFEQAAKVGDSQVQVTAYVGAAFTTSQMVAQQKTATPTDYAKVKSYADKALALSPNDPQANFAEGVALAGQWAAGGKSDSGLKSQALAALSKAKSAAQSAGNISLSLQIDQFIKANLQ